MNESLRQALVEFLNLQGYAVHPTASIDLDGLGCIDYLNGVGNSWEHACPDQHDLLQFLLEYTIV